MESASGFAHGPRWPRQCRPARRPRPPARGRRQFRPVQLANHAMSGTYVQFPRIRASRERYGNPALPRPICLQFARGVNALGDRPLAERNALLSPGHRLRLHREDSPRLAGGLLSRDFRVAIPSHSDCGRSTVRFATLKTSTLKTRELNRHRKARLWRGTCKTWPRLFCI